MPKKGVRYARVTSGRSRSWAPRPITLCAAVSLAFSKYAQAQTQAQSQWKPNVEYYVKPGTDRSYTGVEGVVPLWQDARSLGFADMKFKLGSHDSLESNLGAVYRSYLKDNDAWAYGVYGAWDRRRAPDSGENFNQLTVGAELRSAVWDVRANYYAPLTDKKLVGLGSSQFAGFGVFRNGVFEEAMRGGDVEVGGRLPFSGPGEMRAYVAAYRFKGEDIAPKTTGGRVRLEYSPRQDWTLGLSAQRDSLFNTAVFVEIRYAFGKSDSAAPQTLKERMVDPWVRDIDVAISPSIESGNPKFWRTVQTSGAVHVDSSKPAGGDGSYERPYDSTTACFADKCNVASTNTIRLWQGNSPTTPYTSVALLPGQTLWGQGVDIYTNKVSPGLRPTIGTGGTAITLASNTTVAGVRTYGGIVGYNVFGNVTIRDNFIESAGRGIDISNNSGSGAASITIARNTIATSGNGSFGVYVSNYAGSGENMQQVVTLTGNTITTSGDGAHGVVLRNSTDYGSASQTATVSGNTISASGNQTAGVLVSNFAYGSGALAGQTVTLTGNTITARGNGSKYGGAVGVGNSGKYGGTATQTATLSGNTITAGAFVFGGPKYTGVSLLNFGVYGGTANQMVTLSGNTITARGSYSAGVSLLNLGVYGGTASQTATLSGNNIAGGTGVFALNAGGYGPGPGGNAMQSVVLSGNNIQVTTSTSKYGGVGLFNVAENGGTATQNVTLAGNSISGISNNAVGILSYSDGTAAASQSVVLTGNTLNVSGPSSVGVVMGTKYSGPPPLQSVVLQSNTINAGASVYNFGVGTCTLNGAACPPPLPSDRRLKKDIVYRATLEGGIRIYSFRYLWSEEIFVGVMAQDLLAAPALRDAVILTRGSFYVVDYRALGLKMITLDEWLQSPDRIFARKGRGLPVIAS
jgi:hypothetical protein